jgi:hypothetical protein
MRRILFNIADKNIGRDILVLWLVLLVVSPALAQDYDLSWSTIANGGGRSVGGQYELTGTIGQPDAGYSAGGNYELLSGFWLTIIVISEPDAAIETLGELTDTINALDPAVFKNKNMAGALTNKINAALNMIEQGLYQQALNKLENDILAKTDGCATIGTPDKNDWIATCSEQGQVYPLILEAIQYLEAAMQ